MSQETQPPSNMIHESMCLDNLLLLLSLFLKKTMRKKPLVDYSQSQVMIYIKYLNIQREKIMNKVTAKEIKEGRQKEKEVKWLKKRNKFGNYNKSSNSKSC